VGQPRHGVVAVTQRQHARRQAVAGVALEPCDVAPAFQHLQDPHNGRLGIAGPRMNVAQPHGALVVLCLEDCEAFLERGFGRHSHHSKIAVFRFAEHSSVALLLRGHARYADTTSRQRDNESIAMKLGTILHNGRRELVGACGEDKAVLLRPLLAEAGLAEAGLSMNDFIEAGAPALEAARAILARSDLPASYVLSTDGLDWLAPQPRPSKILGVAFNNMGIRKAAFRDPGVP